MWFAGYLEILFHFISRTFERKLAADLDTMQQKSHMVQRAILKVFQSFFILLVEPSKEKLLLISHNATNIPYGLAVRIPGFHPGGPGSTPGIGRNFNFALLLKIEYIWFAGYFEILFHFISRTFERKLAADLDTMQQISHMVQRAILKFLQSFFILLVEPSKEKLLPISHNATNIPYGLAVRIPGFHPGGPGSTPGMGRNFNFALLLKIEYIWFAGYFQILFHFISRSFERKLAADLDTMQQISHMVLRAILKFLQSFFILLVEPSKEKLLLISHNVTNIPYGLAVRIPGFHPGGPGSTPGMGRNFNFALLLKIEYVWFAGYFQILFHFISRTFERKLAAVLDTMQQISHMVQRAILKFLQSFFILLVEPSKEKLLLISHNATNIPYGLAVRIPGFHPGGPGSTPGMGMNFNFALLLKIEYM